MPLNIKLNPAGVVALLQDPGVLADLEARGNAIAAAAEDAMASSGFVDETGEEAFVVDARIGQTRARVSVRTESFMAKLAEGSAHVLTSSIDAARND